MAFTPLSALSLSTALSLALSLGAAASPAAGAASTRLAASGLAPAVAWSPTTTTLGAGRTDTSPIASNSADQSATVTYSVKGLPSGRSVYTRLQLRKDGSSFYAAQVRSTTGGRARLEIHRVVKGKYTVLKTISLGKDDPTRERVLSFTVNGAKLSAVTWFKGSSKPSTPQLSVDDTTSKRLTQGTAAAVSGYLQARTTGKVRLAVSAASAEKTAPVASGGAGGVTGGGSAADKAEVAGWGTPVWRDEFNDDRSQWNNRDRWLLSYDWAQTRAENVTVQDGTVNLATNRLSSPMVGDDGRARWYSGAAIDTRGKYSQAYGRWEVRAKLSTVKGASKGIWPGFWLRPDGGGNGEIDVVEAYGTPNTKGRDISGRTEATVHFQTANQAVPYKIGEFTPASLDVNDGAFHVWAVEWTPRAITFFVDGQQYHQVTAADDSRFDKVFSSGRPFHLRLNQQVGSDYWGEPNANETADHTDFVVDYVRAWAYKG